MVWTKFVQKIKTHIFLLSNFISKQCPLWDNVENTERQTPNVNMVHAQFMLIPKATDTHSQYGTYAVHADS